MSDNDPVFQEFAQRALKEMLPKVLGSAIFVSIAPRDKGVGDVKYWCELGAGIMHDKPIIVVKNPGDQIPERLRRVADYVIDADIGTEAGREHLGEQIAVIVTEVEDNE